MNSAKFYVPIVALSINNINKFLENSKQTFKRTIFWNKYRSKIIIEPKLTIYFIFLIQLLGILIYCLFFCLKLVLFNDDPERNSFDNYYIPTREISQINILIDNKAFFDQPINSKQEPYENLIKALRKK